MIYKRTINDLEQRSVKWWPSYLQDQNSELSVLPKLLKSQNDFLNILALCKSHPEQIFDLIKAAKFPVNLFLKHLSVLSDYGGEPIQRLGRSFEEIFEKTGQDYFMDFLWDEQMHRYTFKALPTKALGNKKLKIDGQSLANDVNNITPLHQDMIMLLTFGSTSSSSNIAGLSKCDVGEILGDQSKLDVYIQQRYLIVSRITGGAKANSLGQLAQSHVINRLKSHLGSSYSINSNGVIQLKGYEKRLGMPFDIVISKGTKKIGIELSFQETTNSTIERKARQASETERLMHDNGHHIAYIIDGAGNFQRRSAVSIICQHSECTVAFTDEEFKILASWIKSIYD